MLRELKIFGLAVAAVIGLGAMSANAVVIDDFSGDALSLNTFTGGDPDSDVGSDTVTISTITFDRDAVLDQTAPAPADGEAASLVVTGSDVLAYNNDVGVTSVATMTYTPKLVVSSLTSHWIMVSG